MKLPRRNFLHLAAGAAALPAVSRIARAQAYPARHTFACGREAARLAAMPLGLAKSIYRAEFAHESRPKGHLYRENHVRPRRGVLYR